MTAWTCAACGGENPGGTRFCGHCGAPAAEAPAAPAPADESEALRSFVSHQVAERLIEGGGRLEEERRLVTALFADISGFTPLADRLDPEELLEVIDPVVRRLSDVVGRYDGYVEKFAGDALLALFGAPVSHDDDAERALEVALEMHRELAEMRTELPADAAGLTLHVGINSGHGIARVVGSEARTDYAVLGDSVILAQRLESAAPSGETYVSDLTYRLAGGRFEFEPVGELTLKGKSEPVTAWRLVGRRAEGRPTPVGRLVGRGEELATGFAFLDRVTAGAAALTVTGEPGVGKSRLAEELRGEAGRRGIGWLAARCVSYGAGIPYWPYVDLVRRAADLRGDEPPETTRSRLEAMFSEAGATAGLPFVAQLLGLPDVDGGVADLEPEALRRGLHDAISGWLVGSAGARPLVLALEDLHWADASSLELTAEIARRAASAPLGLVLLTRPDAAGLLEATAPGATAIALEPLGPAATRELVEELLDGDVPPALVEFVNARTGGNAFFVQEVVRALEESSALVARNGVWQIQRGWDERHLPPTVEEVLASRIDRLPREAAAVLQVAAVIGRRARVPLIEALVGPGTLDAARDRLVDGGFFEDAEEGGEPVLVFRHALLQDAAYSRLLRRRRRELHLRVAETAEALYGSGDHVIDLLARHLYLGGAGERAVDYLVRAGRRAKRLFANEEAILHLGRALELAPDDTELALELAALEELVGSYEEAMRLFRDVRERTADPRAWAGLASTLRRRGEYESALEVVDDAFRTEDLRGADLRALWLELGWSLSLSGRYEQAIDVYTAGLAAVDGAEDALTGRLLLQLARNEHVVGKPEDALEHVRRAEAIFERQNALPDLATALRILGDTERHLGRLDDAAATLGRAHQLAERVGNAEEIGGSLVNLGIVEAMRGNLDAAAGHLRRAIGELERIGHEAGCATGHVNLAETLYLAGELDEAVTHAELALSLGRAIGNLFIVADATRTLARVAHGRGAMERASEQAEAAGRLFLEIGAGPEAADAFQLAADASTSAGDDERARELVARARSLA